MIKGVNHDTSHNNIRADRAVLHGMGGKGIDFEEYEEDIRDYVQRSDRW